MRQVLTVAALALLAQPAMAQDFRWSGSIASGKTLEVRGVNGGVRAVGVSGSNALVTAKK